MAGTKGKIAVGLINIEVRLEKATDDEGGGDQHTVCTGTSESPHDPSRVKMKVGCPSCGIEHSSVFGYPERGREVDGKVVLITAEEIAAASGAPIKTMVPTFHNREKVFAATVAADSVQNITPEKGSERQYIGLRNVLASHPEMVACAVWAPKTKNALWVLEVVGDRIVASKRCWPEDVRATPAVPVVEITEAEEDMFNRLVEGLVEDFDVARYVDQRKLGVEALIQERLGNAVTLSPEAAATFAVSAGGDMLAALQASIDANTKKAGPKPAKKVAKKKAPAKKVAAKRTTTRKKVA